MRFVFIGSSNFGLCCPSASFEILGLKVVGVVTAPQTFAISYRLEGVSNVLYDNVASFAAERGLQSKTLVRCMGDVGLFDPVASWWPVGIT